MKTKTSQIINKYNEIAKRVLSQKHFHFHLNLGYWENTLNVEDACKNLILKFADFAELSNSQNILDIGVGYGEQDIILAQLYKTLIIDGIDYTPIHAEIARKRIDQAGLNNRVNLQVGDISKIDLKPSSYDRVIAIESAFHFPREVLFEKAYKTLKPGGIIALADIIFSPKPNNKQTAFNQLGVNKSNLYSIHEYINKLKCNGFINIKYIDISNQTIPYSAVESAQDRGWRSSKTIKMPTDENRIEVLINNFKNSTNIEGYYLIKAQKP